MKNGIVTSLLVLALCLANGCARTSNSSGGPTRFVIVTPDTGTIRGTTTTYNLEASDKLILLDHGVEQSIAYPSVLERLLEDGRLEVIANVKNRLNRRIEVQISCVFKDQTGFLSTDEAPFRTLILTENAEEAVRFVSLNDQARTYTIRIRQAR